MTTIPIFGYILRKGVNIIPKLLTILCLLLLGVSIISCQNGTNPDRTSNDTEDAECIEPPSGVTLSPYPAFLNQEVTFYLPGLSQSIQDTLLSLTILDSVGNTIRIYGGAKPFPEGLVQTSGDGWEWTETFTTGEPGRWILKAEIRKSISLGKDYEEKEGSFCVNKRTAPAEKITGDVVKPPETPRQDSGKILFSSDDWFGVYQMSADGTYQRQLIKEVTGFWGDFGHWSSDGRYIAFPVVSGNQWDIWVMDADGSNLSNVTKSESDEWWAVWSPDGTFIAFATGTSVISDDHDIYVMRADGSDKRFLVKGNIPSWSPDGRYIAYVNEYGRISVVDSDGSNMRILADAFVGELWPVWALNSNYIAFSGYSLDSLANDGYDYEIFAIDVGGLKLIQLTDDEADERSPAWSPDGRYLAFPVASGNGWDIWIMNADGSNIRRLTYDGEEKSFRQVTN